ncbi:MAG: AAA family ATPase [Candidatus Saccharimonadales bacterium]
MKPDIILITGLPGSGKSTLVRKLDELLYGYVHIDIDDILQSFWERVENPEVYDREKVGVPKAWGIIDDLMRNGVRLIVDAQIAKNRMMQLHKNYRLINIHCFANDTAERFYRRELLPDGTEPNWLGKHMEIIRQQAIRDHGAVNIGQKIINVDCNDGFNPSIKEIVKLIEG